MNSKDRGLVIIACGLAAVAAIAAFTINRRAAKTSGPKNKRLRRDTSKVEEKEVPRQKRLKREHRIKWKASSQPHPHARTCGSLLHLNIYTIRSIPPLPSPPPASRVPTAPPPTLPPSEHVFPTMSSPPPPLTAVQSPKDESPTLNRPHSEGFNVEDRVHGLDETKLHPHVGVATCKRERCVGGSGDSTWVMVGDSRDSTVHLVASGEDMTYLRLPGKLQTSLAASSGGKFCSSLKAASPSLNSSSYYRECPHQTKDIVCGISRGDYMKDLGDLLSTSQ